MLCDNADKTTHWAMIRPTRGRAFPARSRGTWTRRRGSTACDWTAS